MWVKFKTDYSYRQPSFTIAYKAGDLMNVTRDCAEKAIAKGSAHKASSPRKTVAGHIIHGDESKDVGARSIDAKASPISAGSGKGC